jgi:DNA-3-methyladenine glycosylase
MPFIRKHRTALQDFPMHSFSLGTPEGGKMNAVLGTKLPECLKSADMKFDSPDKTWLHKLRRPLTRAFFNRDPRIVSPDLLGKVLVRREGRKLLAGRVVEVEAYLGSDDPAAHSAAGKTARNAVLFGPPGYAYVYFIYGNHFCLNVSCLPDGQAGGILFRALEPLAGVQEMGRQRDVTLENVRDLRKLASGPGRLAEAFGITRDRDNEKDLTSTGSDLFLCHDGFKAPQIAATRRIGITKAEDMPLRYVIVGNAFVSGPRKLEITNRLPFKAKL